MPDPKFRGLAGVGCPEFAALTPLGTGYLENICAFLLSRRIDFRKMLLGTFDTNEQCVEFHQNFCKQECDKQVLDGPPEKIQCCTLRPTTTRYVPFE